MILLPLSASRRSCCLRPTTHFRLASWIRNRTRKAEHSCLQIYLRARLIRARSVGPPGEFVSILEPIRKWSTRIQVEAVGKKVAFCVRTSNLKFLSQNQQKIYWLSRYTMSSFNLSKRLERDWKNITKENQNELCTSERRRCLCKCRGIGESIIYSRSLCVHRGVWSATNRTRVGLIQA